MIAFLTTLALVFALVTTVPLVPPATDNTTTQQSKGINPVQHSE